MLTTILRGRRANIRRPLASAIFAALLAAILTPATMAQDPEGGDNYKAPDVERQFRLMKHNGSSMAFQIREDIEDSGDRGNHHYQGIVRGQSPGGMPYMFLSHNNHGGMINVVRLETRFQDTCIRGGRLRSNLLWKNLDTDDTVVLPFDRVVHNIEFVASGNSFLDSGMPLKYEHPAGMQIIDDVLVVAVEGPKDWNPPQSTAIVLIDVKNPENPNHLFTLYPPPDLPRGSGHGIQSCLCVAITKDPSDGRYIIAAMYDIETDDANWLGIYKTQDTNLRNLKGKGDSVQSPQAIQFIDSWNKEELGDEEGWWEGGRDANSFQSINFVRQSDDQLYLLCGRSTDGLSDSGNEFVYLFRAWFEQGNQFKLDYITRKEYNRKYAHSGQMGDFGAASGIHITPQGDLLVYSAPHYNQGPPSQDGSNTQRFGEWYIQSLDEDGQIGLENTWVELYDKPHGWNDKSSRSVIFDSRDYHWESYENLGEYDDFNNRTVAIFLAVPPGVTIRLYKDRGGTGTFFEFFLPDGGVASAPDIREWEWPGTNIKVRDDGVSAVRFFGNYPVSFAVPLHFRNPREAEAFLTGNPCNMMSVLAGVYGAAMTFDKPVLVRPVNGPVQLGE